MLVAVTRIKKWGLSGLHLTFTLVSRISLLYGYFSTNMDIQGIQQMFGVRDESFITSWGAGYIQGGGSEIFLVMYWGVENKMTYGQGGGHVFRQVLGGSDVFHWSFFSLKVIASGGLRPQTPL